MIINKNISVAWLSIIILCMSFSSFAQEKPSKLKKKALLYERYGDVYAAIENYEKYIQQSPNRPYTSFHLAQLYERIRDYEKAKEYYKIAYDLKPKKYAKSLFHYGVMLKMNGEYELAKETLTKARKKLKGKGENALYRKLARKEIEGCDLALEQLEKPLNVHINKLNETVNFDHIDYSPFPLNDSLMIFASVRVNEVIRYLDDQTKEKEISSSFYHAKKINDIWQGGFEVSDSFNIPGADVGNGVLCPHGNRFYFTVCNQNSDSKNSCAIYYSEKKKGKWQSPKMIEKPINLRYYTSTQPAVAIESKRGYEVLYFASDRPGGKGGMDLWYSVFSTKTNAFSAPKNMGGKINSPGDETTPFYDLENHRLYYSSNGKTNIGGLDVFKSTGELKRWEEPVNLGYPINSCADDIYYVLNPDNKSEGFLVSNRTGSNILQKISCCDDIYSFNYPDFINIILKGNVVAIEDTAKVQYIENLISESPDADIMTGVPAFQAVVSLYLISPDEENVEFLIKSDTTDFEGAYSFKLENGNKYKIRVSKDDYFSRQRQVETYEITQTDTLIRDLYIIKIPEKPLVIRNIYYPFDKSYLTDSAKSIIDSTILILMQDNPKIIAEISSHTDSKGALSYNERLSQRRAQSVVDYLIKNGIAKERLQAKGYGETQSIAPNENPDGSDNPEGRQKNRRTEFRVIGLLPEYSEIIYEE